MTQVCHHLSAILESSSSSTVPTSDTFLATTKNNTAHASGRTLTGILLLVISTFVFAVSDAITKQLTQLVPVSQILFVRFFAFSVMALIIAAVRTGIRPALHSAIPYRQTFRVLIMCFEIGLFAYGIRFLGLAEMHAVMACFPLIVTALSVPLLGESVGWRRWAAVLCGFIGTLIILQPGTQVFDPYALIPLACATIYAVYILLTRQVSRYDRFETSLLYFGLVGLLASSAVVVFQWQAVTADTAWLLLAVCIASVAAHLLLIKSLELAAAVILQPFNYLILVWAILLGYLLFGETLSGIDVIGVAIVVGSGVYIGIREYSMAKVE